MTWLLYYIIFAVALSSFFILFFILVNYILKKYPKSKLSNFFRRNIVSDIDEEPYK